MVACASRTGHPTHHYISRLRRRTTSVCKDIAGKIDPASIMSKKWALTHGPLHSFGLESRVLRPLAMDQAPSNIVPPMAPINVQWLEVESRDQDTIIIILVTS